MRIASWNVNSVKARLDHVLTWIDSRAPDILMLQELKGLEFPAEPFAERGYSIMFKSQKAYNGVALLSRLPIEPVLNALPGDEADDQARYLEADIGGVRVINIYAPNGNPVETEKFPYKLAWLRRLCYHAAALRAANVPFLIGGDFNIIPDNRDCVNPESWLDDALFRPETRRLFRELCNLGLTDAMRVFHTGPGIYTFWDYFAGSWETDKGIRIDHFLVSPPIADRLLSCEPDKEPRGWERASDHTPVVITLRAA